MWGSGCAVYTSTHTHSRPTHRSLLALLLLAAALGVRPRCAHIRARGRSARCLRRIDLLLAGVHLVSLAGCGPRSGSGWRAGFSFCRRARGARGRPRLGLSKRSACGCLGGLICCERGVVVYPGRISRVVVYPDRLILSAGLRCWLRRCRLFGRRRLGRRRLSLGG